LEEAKITIIHRAVWITFQFLQKETMGHLAAYPRDVIIVVSETKMDRRMEAVYRFPKQVDARLVLLVERVVRRRIIVEAVARDDTRYPATICLPEGVDTGARLQQPLVRMQDALVVLYAVLAARQIEPVDHMWVEHDREEKGLSPLGRSICKRLRHECRRRRLAKQGRYSSAACKGYAVSNQGSTVEGHPCSHLAVSDRL